MAAMAVTAFTQGTVVVHDPTKQWPMPKLSTAEQAILDKALLAVRRTVPKDICDQEPEAAGVARGAFTRPGSRQMITFYQICQTGNGLGWVGLILSEGDKVIGNYVADSGWTVGVQTVPDIDRNGLDEFVLAYGGGIHQGEGGVGVDVMQFVSGAPKGIGWYQAEKFDESENVTVWKLTARPGKSPVFYKQRFTGNGQKYKPAGAPAITKLRKAYGAFERVK